MTRELKRGQLVYSLAGRDKGETYIVLEVLDEKFVSVVNGRKRTVDKPKKKNIRHLQPVNKFAEAVREKKKSQIIDLEIRQAIDRLAGMDS
ncbi:MAG: hypothetical protein H0Z35_09545 [Thermoanaerobacteraceae bacterium]|nr:hypothetical protein [Thermoanaerobacteraceae bacterium]